MNHPELSIIIPVRELDQKSWNTILRFGELKERFPQIEVIVVLNFFPTKDMSSTDYRIQFVHEPRRGCSFARNSGAKSAKSDWIFFTDDSCLIGSKSIKTLLAALPDFAQNIHGIQLPVTHLPLNASIAQSLIYRYHFLHYRYKTAGTLMSTRGKIRGQFDTAAFVLRKSTFMEVGGFDEKLERYEDRELARRLLEMNKEVASFPAAQVTKFFDTVSVASFLQKSLHDFYGKTYSDLKNKGFLEPIRNEVRAIKALSSFPFRVTRKSTYCKRLITFGAFVSLLKRASFPFFYFRWLLFSRKFF